MRGIIAALMCLLVNFVLSPPPFGMVQSSTLLRRVTLSWLDTRVEDTFPCME